MFGSLVESIVLVVLNCFVLKWFDFIFKWNPFTICWYCTKTTIEQSSGTLLAGNL